METGKPLEKPGGFGSNSLWAEYLTATGVQPGEGNAAGVSILGNVIWRAVSCLAVLAGLPSSSTKQVS